MVITANSVFVYAHDCADFSTTGICGDLQPVSCYFDEEKNGISQIDMTLYYDSLGKWKEVKVGRYLGALVPVRVVPKIDEDAYSGTVQMVRIKTGTRKVYVDKACKRVQYIFKNRKGTTPYKILESDIDPNCAAVRITNALGISQVANKGYKGYISVNDYDTLETVSIPATLNGVESVTGNVQIKPQLFIITSVEQALDGVYVEAKHVFYELLQNATTYKTDNTVQGAAACRQVLEKLISPDDRFDIFSDCTAEQKSLDYDRLSPVEALLDPEKGICARYGLSLIRDNYSIYALQNVGTDRGFVVEYGKNLLDLDYSESIEETYTRIIPYGKDAKGNPVYLDGVIWIDSPNIGDYPSPRVLLLDCTDTAAVSGKMTLSQARQELRRRANEEITNGIDKPEISMTIDFLSLGDTEEYKQYRGLDKVYLYDRVTVRDKVRGYDYSAEVVGVRHNVLTGALEQVTIGSIQKASGTRKIAAWQVPSVNGENIRLKSISSGILAEESVGDENLKTGCVSADKIEANAISAEKIKAGAITAEKLAASAVEADNIKAGAVTAEKLAAGSVTAAKLSAGAVTAEKIAARTITAEKIAAGTVTAESGILADGVVGTAQIADGSITDAKIVGLTASKITAGTINAAEININNLNADNITAGTINGQHIPTLGGDKIEDGAISGVKIVNGAVETEKIKDGAVTAAKIVAEAVTAEKIAANAVTANKILAGAVTADKLAANAVTADKIAANTITTQQLAASVGSDLDLSSNESINLKVGAVEGRVSAAETQIAQNATDIGLRATKTELDGLQIGGVNLMLDTRAYGGNGGANYTVSGALQTETYNGFAVRRGENTSDENALQFKMAYAFQPGESYTLSFWAKGSGAAQALITGYAYPCTSVSSEGTAGTDAGGANTFKVTSDWKRYWVTFTMGNWATVPTGKELLLRARNSTSGRVLDVCGLKLERGSRATDWSPSPEDPARSVKTSSVTVNGSGIWLDSTGEISLAAGGKINIQSGADEGNQILLGDLFSATDQGGVTGKTANFGNLLVGGNPAAALGGNIVVATAQPSGNGILWLKPNSVATVQYQRATPSTRSWWLEGTRVIESIAAKTTDVLPGGTIHYKLTLPLYALSRLEGVVVAPRLSKSGISGEVALGAQTISILGLNVLTLEGESAINLGAAPGTPITLTLTVTNGDGQKLFVQSDTTIQLEISNRTVASGGVQTLEAYWIP